MPKLIYKCDGALNLEAGGELNNVHLAYHTYGKLNDSRDNVILVCHAFSASSDVSDWWPGLFGTGQILDPNKYFIICPNIIGSPYGSTCPIDIDPKTQKPYLKEFPLVTVRDMVATYESLLNSLDINGLKMLIGASFGGHQAVELAFSSSKQIDNLVLIACSAKETAWSKAIHQAQRLAIEADVSFNSYDVNGGQLGMKAARGMALLNYRTIEAFIKSQSDQVETLAEFKAASYINYQGEKMVKRFNAYSYYALLNSLDSHDLGRKRNGLVTALQQISSKTLSIGINSDQLIPIREQKFMAEHIPNASYHELSSDYGHDGFLIETDQLTSILRQNIAI